MIDYHKMKSIVAENATKRDLLIRIIRETAEAMGEDDRKAYEAKLSKVLTNYIRRLDVDRVGIVTSFLCERTQASPAMVNYDVFRREFVGWCKSNKHFEVGSERMIRIIHRMGYPSKKAGMDTYIVGLILNSGAGTRPGVVNGKVRKGRPKGSKNKPKGTDANPAE